MNLARGNDKNEHKNVRSGVQINNSVMRDVINFEHMVYKLLV